MRRTRISRGRRSRPSTPVFCALLALWVGGVMEVQGQDLVTVVQRFQSSWADRDVRALQAMMSPSVGLDMEGEAHLGVPPRQAAATLDRLFDRYAPATPEVVRHSEPPDAGEGGFAEFRWRPLTAHTAEPVAYVIFVLFRPVGSELRIAELRVLR